MVQDLAFVMYEEQNVLWQAKANTLVFMPCVFVSGGQGF